MIKLKKIGLVIVASIFMFAAFVVGGCTRWETDYEWGENSFYFSAVANKTDVRVGDTVEITATFKNLSGRNLQVTVPAWREFDDDPTNLEQLIIFGFRTLITRAPRTLHIPYNAVVSVVETFVVWGCDCEYLLDNWYDYLCCCFTNCGLYLYGYDIFDVGVGVLFYTGRLRRRDRSYSRWPSLLDRVALGTSIAFNRTTGD